MSNNSLVKFKNNKTYMEITEMWVLGSKCQRCPLCLGWGFRICKYMVPPLLSFRSNMQKARATP